jgi:hypothetical protein
MNISAQNGFTADQRNSVLLVTCKLTPVFPPSPSPVFRDFPQCFRDFPRAEKNLKRMLTAAPLSTQTLAITNSGPSKLACRVSRESSKRLRCQSMDGCTCKARILHFRCKCLISHFSRCQPRERSPRSAHRNLSAFRNDVTRAALSNSGAYLWR